eukprot:CAMPEP_0172485584 /NCGR_PEP_ID=MMETSP1066-20121228/13664_1 /TAXON_ID=671091 /ORGANISM="Coscinodiscus wailesii, Strain CCMP2513" /LENGTH=244 /DNA_ID=CAMNT_0013250921 /DNA_START=46 /DNA_END=782 /DNA_ORIENTATION=+
MDENNNDNNSCHDPMEIYFTIVKTKCCLTSPSSGASNLRRQELLFESVGIEPDREELEQSDAGNAADPRNQARNCQRHEGIPRCPVGADVGLGDFLQQRELETADRDLAEGADTDCGGLRHLVPEHDPFVNQFRVQNSLHKAEAEDAAEGERLELIMRVQDVRIAQVVSGVDESDAVKMSEEHPDGMEGAVPLPPDSLLSFTGLKGKLSGPSLARPGASTTAPVAKATPRRALNQTQKAYTALG